MVSWSQQKIVIIINIITNSVGVKTVKVKASVRGSACICNFSYDFYEKKIKRTAIVFTYLNLYNILMSSGWYLQLCLLAFLSFTTGCTMNYYGVLTRTHDLHRARYICIFVGVYGFV